MHQSLLVLSQERGAFSFVRLANAIFDPARYPVPDDLAALLQECVAANGGRQQT
jgi:hypothetical protein